MSITQTVIITQILKDNGWMFLDEGTNRILKVWNSQTNEEFMFKNEAEFESWLSEQADF